MKIYLKLTKFNIVVFVTLTGAFGYFLSVPPYQGVDWNHFFLTFISLYFFASGSFVFNQVQEWRIDAKMPRTSTRPLPQKKVSVFQANVLGFGFLALGVFFGFAAHPRVALLGLVTAILYNVFYTWLWKKKWPFAAVPGALPGAMPVLIGFSANSGVLWRSDIVHAFLILFLWQMPHFWALAIRYENDYRQGGIPVLPVARGVEATKFYIGLYLFAYLAVAVASPIFTNALWVYLLCVLPMSFFLLWQFWRYWHDSQRWLRFFLWINASVLVFLAAPVADRFWFGG